MLLERDEGPRTPGRPVRPSSMPQKHAMASTTSSDCCAYPKKRRASILRVGTDFSGLDVVLVVLARLGIAFEHCFSSDKEPHCEKVILNCHRPGVFYKDVCTRDVTSVPPVDLYVFGPPCQPFSSAGRRHGLSDERGGLFCHSLQYIEAKLPSMVIFENVSKVMTTHQEVLAVLIKKLSELKYVVNVKLLNTMDFGIPQHKET